MYVVVNRNKTEGEGVGGSACFDKLSNRRAESEFAGARVNTPLPPEEVGTGSLFRGEADASVFAAIDLLPHLQIDSLSHCPIVSLPHFSIRFFPSISSGAGMHIRLRMVGAMSASLPGWIVAWLLDWLT